MAGLGRDRTVDQVESAASSARQFGEQSEIRETKANGTENILKRHSLHPNKICTGQDDTDKAIETRVAGAKTVDELRSIISDQQKTISDLKLALIRKHAEERKVSQTSHVQSTQTEAVPLFPIKPTPPKEGAPRKNGRHHRRHQTYPFSQDGMPLNNYSQRDVGIQTLMPSNPRKGLLISISDLKPQSKGRQSSHNDREPHKPEALPPIPVGDVEQPSLHHSHAGTVSVEIPAINCVTQQYHQDEVQN